MKLLAYLVGATFIVASFFTTADWVMAGRNVAIVGVIFDRLLALRDRR